MFSNPFWRRSSRWLLTVAVLVLFIVYFALNTEKFRPLLDVKLWLLGLIAVADLVLIISNGLLTKYILKPFDKHLPLTETTYIALITSVGNFFAPVGAGLAFRAIYLKRKHQVSYSDYIPILAGNYLIVFLVNSFFGLLALWLLRSRSDAHYKLLVLAFAGLVIFSLALALIRVPNSLAKLQSRRLAKLIGLLGKVSEGWRRITGNKKLLAQLSLISASQVLLIAGITWLIICSLHLQATFGALLLFSVISGLSLFLNVTPANLGIKEALYIFSGSVLGFSASQVISIALIDRAVFFIIMFISYLALRSSGAYSFKTRT